MPFNQFRAAAEFAARLVLLHRDLLLAAVPHMAEAQTFLLGIEQFAEQLPFPAVPRAGPDCANVYRGQDGKVPQAFDALHLAAEILDRLGIGEIALLRGVAHQQVIAYQPGNQLGLALRKSEART